MRQYNLDPGVGDVDEMGDMFEINRDTEEYDIFHDWSDTEEGME